MEVTPTPPINPGDAASAAAPDDSNSLSSYLKDRLTVGEAQALFRMSRASFHRFRQRYHICNVTGRCVYGADIVRALENARGRDNELADSLPCAVDYAKRLMKRSEAAALMDVSLRTLSRLSARHSIPLLPGRCIHQDDLIAAFNAERRGGSPRTPGVS
jgi:hypothetical protein